jgi:CheY-like chemotaxis protein
LIVDDEPFYLDWLVDFIHGLKIIDKTFQTETVGTVRDALKALAANRYRAIIVDLNIPAEAEFAEDLKIRGALYQQFPGLCVAQVARDNNHTGRQVMVYSVHDNAEVGKELQRLQCTYLLKGRPRMFKFELRQVLAHEPGFFHQETKTGLAGSE